MSDNLRRIIDLEEEVTEILNEPEKYMENDLESKVLKISKLLEKSSNDDLIYLLLNGDDIHKVVDITIYFKKYKINKKKIKEENTYKEALKKLSLFVERIREASISEDEYLFICKNTDVDNVANYLLQEMSNEDIMLLSQESDDWNYKLFLFEKLKK